MSGSWPHRTSLVWLLVVLNPDSCALWLTVLCVQGVFQSSFAVRPLSVAAGASSAAEGAGNKSSGTGKDGKSALAAQEQSDDAITDQIPQRPMGVVEGTSYTVVIIAAIAMAGTWSRLTTLMHELHCTR